MYQSEAGMSGQLFPGTKSILMLLSVTALMFGAVSQAWAVITLLPTGSPRQLIMRVGSANATVNKVVFDVLNANVSPNPVPVVGVPGSGAPATSPTGGVEVYVRTRNQNQGGKFTNLILTVDSSAGLACVGGSGCGATLIPFNTISWVSYDQDTTYVGFDIQNGRFDGSASQVLTNYWMDDVSVEMSNVLVFTYDNATLYPAGLYLGRVIYTATMP